MINDINGKVLIFSDQHFGLKGNSETKLKIVIQVFKEIINYVKKNDIRYVISAGDIFHSRTVIDVNVINIAYKCISALAKYCKVYLICGNHDSYLKKSIDINSINIFQDIHNVSLVKDVSCLNINSRKAILVPWLGDISTYKKEEFDYMFGHFEISSNYLMKEYISEHSKLEVEQAVKIQNNNLIKVSDKQKINDLVGNFVELVKPNGIVFAGHIHTRKEFLSRSRKFIFVGSPYQQNLGEKDNRCGFYILDEESKYNFIELDNIPKHIEIRISDIVKDIQNFNFDIIKGNILHKIYDIEIDSSTDSKISQKIQDMKPFEELLPDFEVKTNDVKTDNTLNESVEILKKSKLEYIFNYIKNIDQKALDESNIDRKKLFKIVEKYYNEVI